MFHTFLAVSQRVQERPPDAHSCCAKCDCFENVGSALKASVDENLQVLECFGKLLANFEEDQDGCLSSAQRSQLAMTLVHFSARLNAYPSRDLPPWLLNITASTPCSTANLTSSTVCTPFNTIGTELSFRIHSKSSQHRALSIYCPISLPNPLPFLSLLLSLPLIADLMGTACGMRSSASRLPGTGASTVTKTALMPRSLALRRSSTVLERSELTYSWRKKGWFGRAAATMEGRVNEALLEIYTLISN